MFFSTLTFRHTLARAVVVLDHEMVAGKARHAVIWPAGGVDKVLAVLAAAVAVVALREGGG